MDKELQTQLQEIKQLLSLQKEVLTLEEFCLFAGISKNQAYHLTSSRKISFYRPFGKMIYFDKDEVLDFLKQNYVVAENENSKKSNKKFIPP